VTLEQLQRAYRAVPFLPMVIDLADGQRVRIPHREFFFSAPEGRTFTVWKEGGGAMVVDLLLVTALEFEHGYGRQYPPDRGNGSTAQTDS